MNRNILLYFLILLSGTLSAQTISVSVPSHVSVGENFRIAYTVNTQDVEDFRAGNIPSALEVIAGPYTSSQSSFQMVNGHTSSSSTVTFTYTLYASKNGSYIIPAARARVNGRLVSSKAARITVSGSATKSKTSSPKMHEDDEPQMKGDGSRISGNDLFIKVSANKKSVHEQEPILLTYKVYTTVELTQLEGKMPDLNGFHTQEVKLPQQKSFHVERVNGKPYRCVTWSQYVMYPQMTGKMTIPSITFKGIVVQQNRSVDPFEAFFNGGSGYVEVKRNIVAPSIDIEVVPLPKRPIGFSGGVGKFNISAQLNQKDIKAGEPISLRVVIGGIGNLKLIKQPNIAFPKDFDKYDAKITDKTKLTSNGVEGNMIFDFLAVPRNQGIFTIPSIEFVYYDVTVNAYKTLKTQSFKVNVGKGDGNKGSISDFSEDKKLDIHDLKLGDSDIHQIDEYFFASRGYWIGLLFPLFAFVALLIIFRKRAIDNADIIQMKIKKANKIATKRLKKAHELMIRNNQTEFYDEVLRALWGYVGDKLNIPVENLSRENISENLGLQDVDEQTITKFVEAIDECEYERYAPGDASGNMNKTFESAMTAITKIENLMKNKLKHHSTTKNVLMLLVLFMIMPSICSAITKQNADNEYKKGNYQQAIKDYNELLQNGVSADLYYNLGNAYYRSENITQAILAYERALRLSPGDDDIRFNLQLVRSKTIDKITPESEMFFVTWYHELVNFTSVDNWAVCAIIFIVFALVLMLIYLFGPNMVLRKVGFYGSVSLIILFVLSNVFAYQQNSELANHMGAILITPSSTIKNTPANNGTDIFVIHEGTRVTIIDKSMKYWRGIRLDDGREGWIMTSKIEEI